MTDLALNLTDSRAEKIRKLVSSRQTDLTVVLEDVHDPHNIGAVMRTCDAVGIASIHVIIKNKRVLDNLAIGKRASAGARKWVEIYSYEDCVTCFQKLKAEGKKLLGTHLSESSTDLYSLDLTVPLALVFGNEHKGLSDEALSYLDGNFIIPQFGMVQSLNISVACAVSCYEALRQRNASNLYHKEVLTPGQQELYEKYLVDQLYKHKGGEVKKR